MAGDENDPNATNVAAQAMDVDEEATPGHGDGTKFMFKSPSERKSIRRSYRAILNTTTDICEQDIDDVEARTVGKVLKKTKKLQNQIDNAQDAMLDAQVVNELVKLTCNKVSSLKTSATNFTTGEFTEKLKATKMEKFGLPQGAPASQLVRAIGKNYSHIFRRPAGLTFMFGAVPYEEQYETSEQKVRRSRKSGVNEDGLATQAIENMENIPETGASKTEILVKSIYRQLKHCVEANDGEPINYFWFILDPTSFSNSVENMFHFSFLVKEDRAQVFMRNSLPMILPLSGSAKLRTAEEKEEKKQAITALTVEHWEALVKAFKIEEAQIQHNVPSMKNLVKKGRN